MTREEWLMRAVERIGKLFVERDLPALPAVRVSVGWPGGRAKRAAIGQCWSTASARDGVSQIFISPVLEDAPTVLATLVHELVHAVDDCQSGHRGEFARLAKRAGLTGKMTATVAGDALAVELAGIGALLGEYPHAALTSTAVTGTPKQTTRYLKCECPECGYTVRVTQKWLDVGMPACACGIKLERA